LKLNFIKLLDPAAKTGVSHHWPTSIKATSRIL